MAGGPDLYTRWRQEMRRSGFFHAGERVGVAVSGGPDSILLLAFMEKLRRDIGFTLAAVHFNHHLRGEESDGDERFVRERAQEIGIEWMAGEAEVASVREERHGNLEATARELRYHFFFSLIHQGRLDKVATAHTANDQAETVLMRLLRGAGTRGLGGIYPVLDGRIIRPFLSVSRSEVQCELERQKLVWRTDSSNSNPRFLRNRVRLELLPQLEKTFNPEIVRLLKDMSDRARDEEEFLERQAHDRARAWRVREGQEEKIPIRALLEFPAAVGRRVLRQMILASRGNLRSITYRHIEALRQFAGESQSGRSLELPGGATARKEFDWLIVAPPSPAPNRAEYCFPVAVPGEIAVPQLGLVFRIKIVSPKETGEVYDGTVIASYDPLKLTGPLVLRNWRAGDHFCAGDGGKARNMKEFFAQEKIPWGRRKMWPVLACGNEVIWTRGLPPTSQGTGNTTLTRLSVNVDELESRG